MKFDMKNYYTAKEAQERLGIDKNRFNYLVRIKKIIPPKRVQGVYSKLEIDKLARELIAFMVHDESQGLVFSKATKEDIEEEYELAAFMFGSSAVHSIPTRQAWLKANPDTDFIIRDQGRLVGFINMLPIKHETIVEFMAGR